MTEVDELAAYSARPALPGRCADIEPEHVVVASATSGRVGSPLEVGFELAKRLLAEGHAVRLVGEGVTHESTWPPWVTREPGLVVTEIGAYWNRESPVLQRKLTRAIEGWVDATFGDAFAGTRASELLTTSATARAFGTLLEVSGFAAALRERHRGARHHCVDPVLGEVLGAPVEDEGEAARLRWRARLSVAVYASAVRATLGRARRLARSAPMRSWIADQPTSAPAPVLWAALATCWGERANRHVVDMVIKPALARGLPVGVLYITELANVPPSDDPQSDLWRWLREASPSERGLLRFAQAAEPRSVGELRRATTGMLRCAARAERSIARSGPRVELAGLAFDLRRSTLGLASLLTTDVLTARVGLSSAAAAMAGSEAGLAVFAAYALVETTAPATVLRRHGATTVDFVHGSGGSFFPWDHDVPAHVFGVWSHSDAETIARLGGRAVVVGVPRVSGPTATPRRRGAPRRVLVLTNYLHESWKPQGFPLLPHHRQLLSAVQRLRAVAPPDCEFVWRPHPVENQALVDMSGRENPWLVRSRNAELDRDLAEADVLISTVSSAVFEALGWSRPLFLHVLPGYRWFPQIAAFAEERRFYRAEDALESFARCVRLLSEDDPRVLEPERAARAALLPSADQPAPLDAFLAVAGRA